MSSGNTTDTGIFGLFYGISPSYMDGILSTRTPAALITALNQQGYQLGLFSSDGFTSRCIASIVVRFLDAERTHPIRRADRHAVDQLAGPLRTRR